MSEQRNENLAPVGEEIHLHGPSIQPALVAFGFILILLGIIDKRWLSIIGLVMFLWAIALWIRNSAREMRALPSDTEH
ncbi:unannotated protein [freshwater metagenome]|uniref:Unannotated protein n=1 Tax=freshwater metagenome TaxID=449393 RepID=A0A6J7EEC0_9ZZZZ|nr:hypothetical protein [Actinomycetota bacterium]